MSKLPHTTFASFILPVSTRTFWERIFFWGGFFWRGLVSSNTRVLMPTADRRGVQYTTVGVERGVRTSTQPHYTRGGGIGELVRHTDEERLPQGRKLMFWL